MNRFLLSLLALAIAAATAAAQIRNVVMIVSDDQRNDTIAAWGNPHIRTPHLDRLAARGTSFTNIYCMGSMSGAVCAPSRAMFLSGRQLFDIGPNPFNLAADVRLLPEVLRAEGMATFGTGKWHGGRGSFHRSFTHGGSIFFGGMGSHTTLNVYDFDASGEYPKENQRKLREFSSAEFVTAAVDFIESDAAAEPFFVYVSFTAPHDPRTPPEDDLAPYLAADLPLPTSYMPVHPFDNGEMVIRDERLAPWPRTEEVVRSQLAEYYGMITHMDRQIGRVLDALEAGGHTDDTLVVFFGDHGLGMGSHGLMGKQNMYEHSVKAPVIFAGPGVPEGQVREGLGYLTDIPATVCDLMGLPTWWCRGARSMVGAFESEDWAGRPYVVTAYRDLHRAIRMADGWKMIVYPKINRRQLFNLADDPHELDDLAASGERADRRTMALLTQLLSAEMQGRGDEAPLVVDEPASDAFDMEEAERKRTGG